MALPASPRRPRAVTDFTGFLTYCLVAIFMLLVVGVVGSALVDSFATTSYFRGWLPDGYTLRWYQFTAEENKLAQRIVITMAVALAVTAIALAAGVPAAYVLARRNFRLKPALLVLLILPMMVPPITYGIPLTTVLLEYHLAPGLAGVILSNVVPMMPFVVLVMTPFIEQIDPNLERAARMLGAGVATIFLRVVLPLALPGMLAAALLVGARTIGLFELTFLTAGPSSQTLVVVLYYSVAAPGVRPPMSVDAMAVVYMVTNLVLLLAALRFVNPVNMVVKARSS